MIKCIIEQSDTENYTSHSGLSLVGLCLNRYGNIHQVLKKIPLHHGIAQSDIVKSYIGALCLGHIDFEVIENHRYQPF